MKPTLISIAFLTLLNLGYSQSKTSGDYKFRISLNKAITYSFDDNLKSKDNIIDPGVSSFNVELTEIEIGYFITKHHEAGLSIGKNNFTEPGDFISYIFYDTNGDTVYNYGQGYSYINLTWFSVFYNFHFLNDYKAGIKLGEIKPVSLEGNLNGYLSLSIGKFYRVTDNFLIDLTMSYSARTDQLKSLKSNQLNLNLGFNLRI